MLRGLELWRAGRARHLVLSGGPGSGARNPSEPERLRDALVRWGVPAEAIIVEPRSRNTRENAIASARIVAEHRFRTLVLVTSAAHVPRALGCFRAAGLSPDVLPVDRRAGAGGSWLPRACRARAEHGSAARARGEGGLPARRLHALRPRYSARSAATRAVMAGAAREVPRDARSPCVRATWMSNPARQPGGEADLLQRGQAAAGHAVHELVQVREEPLVLVRVSGEAARARLTEPRLLVEELRLGGDTQQLESGHRLVHAPGADRLDEPVGAVEEDRAASRRIDRSRPRDPSATEST